MPDEAWRSDADRRFAEFAARLSVLETAHAVDTVHRTNIEKRLAGIEDTLRWLVRIVVGAIVVAVIGYALKGGFQIG